MPNDSVPGDTPRQDDNELVAHPLARYRVRLAHVWPACVEPPLTSNLVAKMVLKLSLIGLTRRSNQQMTAR